MIKEIDINELPISERSKNENVTKDILEFLEKGYQCAEVDIKYYKNAAGAAASYRATAYRINANVKLIRRQGRVFIVRGN